jgi:hypothetical protein
MFLDKVASSNLVFKIFDFHLESGIFYHESGKEYPSEFAKYLFCQKYTKKILTFRFI